MDKTEIKKINVYGDEYHKKFKINKHSTVEAVSGYTKNKNIKKDEPRGTKFDRRA